MICLHVYCKIKNIQSEDALNLHSSQSQESYKRDMIDC